MSIKTKGRKIKDAFVDGYDVDDPFIDDEELVCSPLLSGPLRRTNGKCGGFTGRKLYRIVSNALAENAQ